MKNQSIFTVDEQNALAEQVYALLPPWDRCEGTVKDVINQIKKDPYQVIEFLLDVINGDA